MTYLNARYNLVIVSVFFLIGGLGVEGQAPGTCYFPGGETASDARPCDPHAITTSCCPVGWTCFSNFACVVTDLTVVKSSFALGTTIRGSCTNPLWNNAFCGDFCLTESFANNGSITDCGSGKWCCGSSVADGTCDCSSGRGTFSIPQGVAQTIISVSGLQSTSTGFKTSTTSSSKTTTSGSTTTTSKTTSASGASKTSTQTTSTASETGTSTPANTPITDKIGFKVGISIAAVALAAILGVIAFFLWKFVGPGKKKREFPTRPSSPAYTQATSEAHRSNQTPRSYTPYSPATLQPQIAPVAMRPDPSRFSQAPTMVRPQTQTPIDRPVSPMYSGSNRFPSMATLPYEGT